MSRHGLDQNRLQDGIGDYWTILNANIHDKSRQMLRVVSELIWLLRKKRGGCVETNNAMAKSSRNYWKTNNNQNTTNLQTNDWSTWILPKSIDHFLCSRMVNSSCSTFFTRHDVNVETQPVIIINRGCNIRANNDGFW